MRLEFHRDLPDVLRGTSPMILTKKSGVSCTPDKTQQHRKGLSFPKWEAEHDPFDSLDQQ